MLHFVIPLILLFLFIALCNYLHSMRKGHNSMDSYEWFVKIIK